MLSFLNELMKTLRFFAKVKFNMSFICFNRKNFKIRKFAPLVGMPASMPEISKTSIYCIYVRKITNRNGWVVFKRAETHFRLP